jgi:energy-coupling factor transporter ATP-binding protein EcfA2
VIPDIVKLIDNGDLTVDHVESLLDVVHGFDETPGKEADRQRVMVSSPEGVNFVKFQLVILNGKAKEILKAVPAEAVPKPVPEEFLRDVPEPIEGGSGGVDLAAEIKSRIGILAAVRKWGKPQAKLTPRGVEGIKVRCPKDSHTDNNPSAWVNSEKQLWHCGACEVGGDVIDFYGARTRDTDPRNLHDRDQFPTLVREMADELGIVVRREPSTGLEFVEIEDDESWPSSLPDRPESAEVIERPVPPDDSGDVLSIPEAPKAPAVPPSPESDEPVKTTLDEMFRGVVPGSVLVEKEQEEGDDILADDGLVPMLDWAALPVKGGTFLDFWMRENLDFYPWVPHEFFFFCGLQAVGVACGHEVTSRSYGMTLSGSTLMALIGPTGGGKSTAANRLKSLLSHTDGPRFDHSLGSGVKKIPSPGSAEALIRSIYTEIEDPADASRYLEVGVNAWLFEDELATLVSRSRRPGGGHLKQRLMQLHDFTKSVSGPEAVIDEFSLTSGKRTIHDTYFSALMLTQTDAMRALMESIDLISGFLNRITPVMGPARTRRDPTDERERPPRWEYQDSYSNLWRSARGPKSVLPFTREALELIRDHPTFIAIERLGEDNGLYVRLAHMMFRFSFLLAFNNGEKEISKEYPSRVLDVMVPYLAACFSGTETAVRRTDMDDHSDKIVSFVKRNYDRKGEWPTRSDWSKDRSYRALSAQQRIFALDSLFREGRIVECKIKYGNRLKKVLIVPEGEWAAYEDAHGKVFKAEDVYS